MKETRKFKRFFLLAVGLCVLILISDFMMLYRFVTKAQIFGNDWHEVYMLFMASSMRFAISLGVMFGIWRLILKPMLRDFKKAVDLSSLQQKVAIAANEADTIEEGVRTALEQVCAYMDWPVGHAYIFDKATEKLISMDAWVLADSAHYQEFKTVSEKAQFAPREEFLGEVYADATPM
ncbi:MAG: hypothetical protein ACOYJ2_04645 [Rickettsiales bacterium]